jgi:hypothetical protein
MYTSETSKTNLDLDALLEEMKQNELEKSLFVEH